MTPADASAPAPDQGTPTESAPEQPGFSSRGRARRRARFLRRARELAYRDLGGLVFNLHRFGQRNDALVLAKLGTLSHIDSELRAIETALRERRPLTVLREAGITACPRCAAIHGSEDRFCPNCGFAIARHADLPIAGAPASPPPEPASPAVQSAPGAQAPPPAQAAPPATPAPSDAPGPARPTTATPAPDGTAAPQAAPIPAEPASQPVPAEPASRPSPAQPASEPIPAEPASQPSPAQPASHPVPAEAPEQPAGEPHTAVHASAGRAPSPPRAREPEQEQQSQPAGETTEILRPHAGGS